MSPAFTGSGDGGYTSLLGGDRVAKYHPRPESYGALDEASAALGLARAMTDSPESSDTLKTAQRDLYHMMAEIAAPVEKAARFRVLDESRVAWIEATLDHLSHQVELPKGFVLGGDTRAGAALDLARTIVRRAERLIARLYHDGEIENPQLLAYLNRLSSLCFVLSLWENQRAGVASPSLAREGDARHRD